MPAHPTAAQLAAREAWNARDKALSGVATYGRDGSAAVPSAPDGDGGEVGLRPGEGRGPKPPTPAERRRQWQEKSRRDRRRWHRLQMGLGERGGMELELADFKHNRAFRLVGYGWQMYRGGGGGWWKFESVAGPL